jgi:hypothetical protein
VASGLCLIFIYGVAVGKWHIFPYRFLDACLDSLRNLGNRKPEFCEPARYEGQGVVVYEPGQTFPGVTLITGYTKNNDGWNVSIRLIDLNGNLLHKWRCNPQYIWDCPPHNDTIEQYMITEESTYVHGALLLSSGEVIFNLEYFGLVRLNSNSEVVWKLPYRTHHSIFQGDDGDIWVCGLKVHRDCVMEFPGLKPPFWEETILKVSLEGVIEREISVLEAIYKSGYHGLLRSRTGDFLHLNDVEVLGEQKAGAFDLFQAGDIMVSMRTINTILVIDGKTERIKWSLTYPFIAQHDPDFTEDGFITVYDNRMFQPFRTKGHVGSRIIRIEPSTRNVTTLYGWEEDQYFYSPWCGKHQHLPNGNILITETVPGRVFEINANGKIVWSWIESRWNKNYVPGVQEGTRYGKEYADFVSGLRKDGK